jgi:hypothetical protein
MANDENVAHFSHPLPVLVGDDRFPDDELERTVLLVIDVGEL